MSRHSWRGCYLSPERTHLPDSALLASPPAACVPDNKRKAIWLQKFVTHHNGGQQTLHMLAGWGDQSVIGGALSAPTWDVELRWGPSLLLCAYLQNCSGRKKSKAPQCHFDEWLRITKLSSSEACLLESKPWRETGERNEAPAQQQILVGTRSSPWLPRQLESWLRF